MILEGLDDHIQGLWQKKRLSGAKEMKLTRQVTMENNDKEGRTIEGHKSREVKRKVKKKRNLYKRIPGVDCNKLEYTLIPGHMNQSTEAVREEVGRMNYKDCPRFDIQFKRKAQ